MKSGWERKTLDELIDVLSNGVNCKQNKSGEGDRVSRIESISKAVFDLSRVGFSKLSSSQKVKYKLLKGDILFSHINSPIHVGKTAIFDKNENVFHGVNLLLIRPKKILDSYYLEYYLKFLFQSGYWLKICKQSVNQASVNQKDIKKAQIIYPESLSEQKRIVRILDEAFEKLEKAKKNTQKNLENAKELFESYLQGIFEKGENDWQRKSVNELCDDIFAGGDAPKKHFSKTKTDELPIPIIANAVKKHGLYGYTDFARVTKPSVTIAARGSGTGHTELRNYPFTPIVRLIVLTPNTNKVSVEFLLHAIKSLTIKKSGSAIPQLTIPMIKTYSIPLPKLSEQNKCVKSLNEMEAMIKAYELKLNQKIKSCVAIKKSLLQKAFSGEL